MSTVLVHLVFIHKYVSMKFWTSSDKPLLRLAQCHLTYIHGLIENSKGPTLCYKYKNCSEIYFNIHCLMGITMGSVRLIDTWAESDGQIKQISLRPMAWLWFAIFNKGKTSCYNQSNKSSLWSCSCYRPCDFY